MSRTNCFRMGLALFWGVLWIVYPPSPVKGQSSCPILPAPEHLSPPDHATLPVGEVTLEWSEVPGAGSYAVWVHRVGDPAQTPEVIVEQNRFSQSYEGNETYVWTVRARPEDLSCPDGDSPPNYLEFTVSNEALLPELPQGLQASDGGYSDRVHVTWQQTTRAEFFLVYRRDSAGGDDKLLSKINRFEFDDYTARSNIKYIYSLKACNSAGCSGRDEDVGWIGSCGQVALAAPELVSPGEGSQVNFDAGSDFITTLDWNDQARVLEYQVETYSSNSGELISQDLTQESQSGFYRDNPVVDTISWRVRAMDPVVGCAAGEWSEIWTFTQNPLWTDRPVEVAASDGTYPGGIQITWEMPGPLDYEVEFFEVFRQAEGEDNLQLIARLDYPEQSYLDTSPEPGLIHTYWVSAFGHQRGASSLSEPDQGWYGGQPVGDPLTTVFLPLITVR